MTRRLMAVRSLMVVAVIAAALLAVVKTAGPAHSSTTVTDMSHGISAPQLAQAIVGSGITVSNVSYTGSPLAAGTFTGNGTAPSGIGFPSGIVMSTGLVQTTGSLTSCPKGVEGPNNCDPNSSDLGQPGDTDLSALAGASANPPVANAQTFDASVLNFDFVPNQSSISISYVFGSEEYNQFVGSQFNDAFGFFVNGHNCALLPDGSPVTVNNVNGNKNASLFRTNLPKPGGIDTEFNGITTVLTCTAAVTQGQTNHMKLAIADTADGGFDSGVYIQGGSFNAGPPPGTTPSTIASNGSNTIQGTIVNSDNVPQQGALAQACILNTLPPQCLALATTDANGNYSIPNVPSNQWVVVGFPPASTDTETLNFVQPVVTAGGALVVAPDIVLKVVGAPPPGTVFATPDGVENNGKPPALNWGDPTGIAIPSCVGAGSATLTITGEDGFSGKTITVTVPLSETSPGVYTGTIPPLMPMHGNANFHVDINCPNPPPDWGGWIDPSGTVTTPSGVPIPGATVTLTRSDTANGTQAPVPSGSAIMSPGNRTNPVTTGGDGVFAWDVVGGFYQVSA
ncbi:MAG TPA: choice-of-anchor L domain-containing protein, partial [Nocardioides sp.]|nr:choice-of-anchor L domain-containing protein [Nocardioides sp.]